MNTYYIYTLSNPKTNAVFYVGCTQYIERRERSHYHITDLKNKVAPHITFDGKKNYILYHNIQPVFTVIQTIENTTKEEAHKIEQSWMKIFSDNGHELYSYIHGTGQEEYKKRTCLELLEDKNVRLRKEQKPIKIPITKHYHAFPDNIIEKVSEEIKDSQTA